MSSSAQANPSTPDFIIGKIGAGFVKFASPELVPEGVKATSGAEIAEMSKDQLEELYSSIMSVDKKTFRNAKVALENVLYQVNKISVFDPAKVEAVSKAAAAPVGDKKYARRSKNVYVFLLSAESESVIKGLAPQARECVAILADFAKEKGRLEFSEEELKEKFEASTDRLVTQQSPWRILQYYRSKLIGSNLLRLQ